MKKYILSVVVLAFSAMAFKPIQGIEGKLFPSIQCEDYNGKKINIPAELNEKNTLIGIVFSNAAEKDLKDWITPVYHKFVQKTDRSKADAFDIGADADVAVYFIPRFSGLNQVASKSAKEKIKTDSDKELFANLLFIESSKNLKEELNFEKKDVPYLFVLDETGKIIFATSGKFDQKKFEKIIDALEGN